MTELSTGPTRTILLVDDNPAIVRALGFGLRRWGFQVLAAENAAAALVVLAQPDGIALLLSDVMMPGVNGVDLARRALQLRPGLAVLLTTGYAFDVIESLGARRDEFPIIAKPYSVVALVTRINELVPPI